MTKKLTNSFVEHFAAIYSLLDTEYCCILEAGPRAKGIMFQKESNGIIYRPCTFNESLIFYDRVNNNKHVPQRSIY